MLPPPTWLATRRRCGHDVAWAVARSERCDAGVPDPGATFRLSASADFSLNPNPTQPVPLATGAESRQRGPQPQRGAGLPVRAEVRHGRAIHYSGCRAAEAGLGLGGAVGGVGSRFRGVEAAGRAAGGGSRASKLGR
eukprot:scaffold4768_cov105-Isochrysis_galbana.AAC.2